MYAIAQAALYKVHPDIEGPFGGTWMTLDHCSMKDEDRNMTAKSAEIFGFRLRHVGVAVRQIDPAARILNAVFGFQRTTEQIEDPIQKVAVSFLKQSEADSIDVELVAPLNEESPICTLLDKNVGAYHLCFETTDLDGALAHAESHGCFTVSGPTPAVAFGGRRIAWIYSPTRQLFELLEAKTASEVLQ